MPNSNVDFPPGLNEAASVGNVIRNVVGLFERGADPAAVSDTGFLYTKDAAGVTQLFYRADDGTVSQITPPASAGTFFAQDGNSFGATAVLGTNDAFDLSFETAGVARGRFDQAGSFLVGATAVPSVGARVYVVAADATNSFILFDEYSNAAAERASLVIRRGRGTFAAPLAVATSDTLGGVLAQAYDGVDFRTMASINGLVESFTAADNLAGAMIFATRSSGAAAIITERMRITSSSSNVLQGNLGLTIQGGSAASNTLTLSSTSNATKGNIDFGTVARFIETTGSPQFLFGTQTALATELVLFQKTQASTTYLQVSNASAAPLAVASVSVSNDIDAFSLGIIGSGGGSPLVPANTGFIRSDSLVAGGVWIGTGAAANITFFTGDAQRLSFLSGSNTIQGNAGLTVQGGAAASNVLTLSATSHATPGTVNICATGSTAVLAVTSTGATVTGKLTVTGSIDPTDILLSGGTALFFESNDGSTAPVSGAATGRIRYNNAGSGTWQVSTQAGAYADLVTTAGGSFFAQGGNSFGVEAVLGTNDAFALAFETSGVTRMTLLSSAATLQGNGGFTLQGGTAASGTMTISSTSNATKGTVDFDSRIRGIDGTSAAPSFGFTTASKGMWLNGASLTITTSTSSSMAADSTGALTFLIATSGSICLLLSNINSSTTGQEPLLVLRRGTTGATTLGIGSYIRWDLEGSSSGVTITDVARYALDTTDVVNATYSTRLTWSQMINGTRENIYVIRETVEAGGLFDFTPETDNEGNFGTNDLRWFSMNVASTTGLSLWNAAADANPTSKLSDATLAFGAGGGSATDVSITRSGANVIDFVTGGSTRFAVNNAGATVTGKLTVTGSIDPTDLTLSGGTAQFVQWGAGSTAAVSGASTGRIRYDEGTNKLQFSNNGGAYADIGGGGSVSFPLLADDGTAGAPSYSFTNSSDSGIYLVAAGVLGVSAAGTEIASFTFANGETQILMGQDGTALFPAYSFAADDAAGMYLVAAGTVGIAASSNDVVHFSGTQILAVAEGSDATPSYSFVGITDTGVFIKAGTDLAFSCAGVEVFSLNAADSQLLMSVDGTTLLPAIAFVSDSSTGISSTGATLSISAVGAEIVSFANSGATFVVDNGFGLANQTDAAGADLGTLTNAPHAGDPDFWAPMVVNGVNVAVPCWNV